MASKELTDLYQNNFEVYAEDCLKVRDHQTSQVVEFLFRKAQKILDAVVSKQAAEKGCVKILNLKTRRYGGSTYVQGRGYWRASNFKNQSVFIIAHEDDATNTLFSMAKLFQEMNPLQPAITYDSGNRLTFDNKKSTGLKSEYRVATARNVHAGKSQGIHILHCSEEAQWQGDPDELLTSLFACVPQLPAYSEIYRESTAQGYGNTFQEDCFEAYAEGRYPYYEKDGIVYAWSNPKSDWVIVFIPFFCVEFYTKEFEAEGKNSAEDVKRDFIAQKIDAKVFDERNNRWVRSEASTLLEKFNLTLEQLYWREDCIKNACRGSVDKFHQNYPATVEEAFLSSGSNVFDKELCDALQLQCRFPLIIGDVHRLGGKSRIKRDINGPLSIWERPQPGETYFMVVDPAGGQKKKAGDKTDREPDRTNIDVFNHRTGNQAAQWNGHVSYDLIHEFVEMVGEMYFMAPACVELMNHGYTVVADLKRSQYPQFSEKSVDDPGWFVTRGKKARCVDESYRMTRDADLQINSKETVSEMRTFVEDPPGTFEAAGSNKDDRVTTLGMASQMMLLLPRNFLDPKDEVRGDHQRKGREIKDNWSRHPNNRARDDDFWKYKEATIRV